jgi:hypothetical protein
MSEKSNYSINCPRCKHVIDVELYDSLNVANEPQLKDMLMRNQVNTVACPSCQLGFRVDKPVLYSDPALRILVYWIPTREDEYEAGEEQFRTWLCEMGNVLPQGIRAPDVHLVFSRVELVERIFLLEQGLNERIVEYVKYLIYTRNVGKINPAEKDLLFNAEDSNEKNLCFVVQDVKTRQLESMLHYSRDAYNALAETFNDSEKTGDLLELFPGPYISARMQMIKEMKTEAQPEG